MKTSTVALAFLLVTGCGFSDTASKASRSSNEHPHVPQVPRIVSTSAIVDAADESIAAANDAPGRLLSVRPRSLCAYALFCVVGTFLIRALLSMFYALARGEDGKKFKEMWCKAFCGAGLESEKCSAENTRIGENDYMTAALMGLLELMAFPILIVSGHPEYIGGWLLFKTLSQWSGWQSRRGFYNRFMIGNALVLVGSYFAARTMF